jgi:hypothetical protein
MADRQADRDQCRHFGEPVLSDPEQPRDDAGQQDRGGGQAGDLQPDRPAHRLAIDFGRRSVAPPHRRPGVEHSRGSCRPDQDDRRYQPDCVGMANR